MLGFPVKGSDFNFFELILTGDAYNYIDHYKIARLLTSLSSVKQLLALVLRLLRKNATKFLMEDVYRNPGPLQFDGPGADSKAVTLCVEDQDYMGRIKELKEYLDKVLSVPSPHNPHPPTQPQRIKE